MSELFTKLISPLDRNIFNEQHLGKKAVYISGEPNKYKSLFNWDCLNNILSTSHFPVAHLSLGTSGLEEKLYPANFTSSKILKSCSNSSTIHIREVNEFSADLFYHFSRIASELKSIVKVNLYASAPEHQAINVHFDDHDVFILQIEGRKNWKVYPAGFVNPEQKQPPELPYLECLLEPGDLLYIPAGHWHVALARTASLHLTIGAYWTKGVNFMTWLLSRIEPDLNQFLPLPDPGKDREKTVADWQKHNSELKEAVLGKLADNNLITEFCRDARVKIHNSANFNFPYHYLEKPVNDLTSVKFYRSENNDAVVTDDANVYLANYHFIFNKDLVPALKFIFERNYFSGRDLLQLVPVNGQELITEVLNMLIKEGIIRLFDIN
jgi:ribosomal protein L16 Arg81 hydroxylase